MSLSCHAGLLHRKWQYAKFSVESKVFCAQNGAVHSYRVQTSSMKRPSKLKIVGQSVLIRKRSSHIWQRERENASPLPFLYSHSNSILLAIRVRINLDFSSQTLKSVQRSNWILSSWIYFGSHPFFIRTRYRQSALMGSDQNAVSSPEMATMTTKRPSLWIPIHLKKAKSIFKFQAPSTSPH